MWVCLMSGVELRFNRLTLLPCPTHVTFPPSVTQISCFLSLTSPLPPSIHPSLSNRGLSHPLSALSSHLLFIFLSFLHLSPLSFLSSIQLHAILFILFLPLTFPSSILLLLSSTLTPPISPPPFSSPPPTAPVISSPPLSSQGIRNVLKGL